MALPPSSSASSLSAASAQPTPLHLHLTSRAPGRLPLLHFSRAALPLPLRARIPRTNNPPGTPLHRGLPPPPSASASPSIAGGGFGSDDAEEHHGGDGGSGSGAGGDEGGGDDGGHNDHGGEDAGDGSLGDPRGEALFVLAQLGRKLDSLPSDLAAAIESGRIGGDIVARFNELEANGFIKWLLTFKGFRERLLADELFLTKLGIECGIGLVAKVGHLSRTPRHSLLFLFFFFFFLFFENVRCTCFTAPDRSPLSSDQIASTCLVLI
jgi:nonsense-mediated mRNA decay protein 3